MLMRVQRSDRPQYVSPLDLIQDDLGRSLRRWWTDAPTEALTGIYPVDVHEDDAHLYVEAEVPGFKREEINVTLEDGVLSIVAQRKAADKKGQSHLEERRYTRIARSFTLPQLVDENKVEAKLEDGVLHLTLNKREEVKPRRIEVK